MRRDRLVTLMLPALLCCAPWLSAQERPPLERAWSVEEVEWIDPVTTRLSLYSNEPGQLVLLDAAHRPLQQEQGQPLWLVHVWQMENEEVLPDQLFYTRFMPETGPAFQRMLRVTPGTDVRLVLIQDQGQWIWQQLDEKNHKINQIAIELAVEPEHYSWMSADALDQDLETFWQLLDTAGIPAPDLSDAAALLQAQGFELLGEGLYAEALLILKESYALHATPELLDRIGRLERYLDLQGQ